MMFLQIFVSQTVAKGSIPFVIEADESAKYRAYVLRELIESKREALTPDTVLEEHDDFMREWEYRRGERDGIVCRTE